MQNATSCNTHIKKCYKQQHSLTNKRTYPHTIKPDKNIENVFIFLFSLKKMKENNKNCEWKKGKKKLNRKYSSVTNALTWLAYNCQPTGATATKTTVIIMVFIVGVFVVCYFC